MTISLVCKEIVWLSTVAAGPPGTSVVPSSTAPVVNAPLGPVKTVSIAVVEPELHNVSTAPLWIEPGAAVAALLPVPTTTPPDNGALMTWLPSVVVAPGANVAVAPPFATSTAEDPATCVGTTVNCEGPTSKTVDEVSEFLPDPFPLPPSLGLAIVAACVPVPMTTAPVDAIPTGCASMFVVCSGARVTVESASAITTADELPGASVKVAESTVTTLDAGSAMLGMAAVAACVPVPITTAPVDAMLTGCAPMLVGCPAASVTVEPGPATTTADELSAGKAVNVEGPTVATLEEPSLLEPEPLEPLELPVSASLLELPVPPLLPEPEDEEGSDDEGSDEEGSDEEGSDEEGFEDEGPEPDPAEGSPGLPSLLEPELEVLEGAKRDAIIPPGLLDVV